ncbi:AP2 domain protein [compost metagenome]
MKYKTLPTQEYLEECFTYDPETGLLYWKERPLHHFKNEHGWNTFNSKYSNKQAFTCRDANGYFVGTLDGKQFKAHRIIWKVVHGTEPETILHDKGRTDDNRIEKLSSDSHYKNMLDQKLRVDNSSGISGVSWYYDRQKWCVRISVNGKVKNLGYFTDLEEAKARRQSAELEYGYHSDHGKR